MPDVQKAARKIVSSHVLLASSSSSKGRDKLKQALYKDLLKKPESSKRSPRLIDTPLQQAEKTISGLIPLQVKQMLTHVADAVVDPLREYTPQLLKEGVRKIAEVIDIIPNQISALTRRGLRDIGGVPQDVAQDLGEMTYVVASIVLPSSVFRKGTKLLNQVSSLTSKPLKISIEQSNKLKNSLKKIKTPEEKINLPQTIAHLDSPIDSGFRGHKGFQLNNAPFQPSRNIIGIINDREFSGHALDQMQNRGIFPSVVENTIKVSDPLPGNLPNTLVYYDPINKVTVVVNALRGRVITVRGGKL